MLRSSHFRCGFGDTRVLFIEYMAFGLSVKKCAGYLYIDVSGEVTEANLVALGHKIHDLCQENELKSVLLDCKTMEGGMSPGDLYFASQKYTEAVGTGINVAYINPPDSWSQSTDYFGRTMVRSRGGSLELFASESEAVEWLKENAH